MDEESVSSYVSACSPDTQQQKSRAEKDKDRKRKARFETGSKPHVSVPGYHRQPPVDKSTLSEEQLKEHQRTISGRSYYKRDVAAALTETEDLSITSSPHRSRASTTLTASSPLVDKLNHFKGKMSPAAVRALADEGKEAADREYNLKLADKISDTSKEACKQISKLKADSPAKRAHLFDEEDDENACLGGDDGDEEEDTKPPAVVEYKTPMRRAGLPPRPPSSRRSSVRPPVKKAAKMSSTEDDRAAASDSSIASTNASNLSFMESDDFPTAGWTIESLVQYQKYFKALMSSTIVDKGLLMRFLVYSADHGFLGNPRYFSKTDLCLACSIVLSPFPSDASNKFQMLDALEAFVLRHKASFKKGETVRYIKVVYNEDGSRRDVRVYQAEIAKVVLEVLEGGKRNDHVVIVRPDPDNNLVDIDTLFDRIEHIEADDGDEEATS